MLTHRERVLLTLDHQATDRVPVDLGGTQTSLLVEPYDDLKRHLGLGTPTRIQNIILGLAEIETPVLEALDIDFRHVLPRMPDDFHLEILPDDSFYDEWSVRWLRPEGGYYYDMVEHPLAEATWEALDDYQWPDPFNPGRVAGVRQEMETLRRETDYALEAGLLGLWESAWFLVGFERWLLDCAVNPEFVEAVLDRTLDVLLPMHTAYLKEAGPYLDLVTLWDDYGAQYGTLIAPDDWRRLVKPRLASLVAALREHTPARIGLHSCGSVAAILNDLVEVGISVLNPIQVSAANMQPDELKKRYGDRLTFWGGIDTQRLMPFGAPEEVSKVVRETIQVLGQNGGYILAAVHNIQPGVPAENILALYQTGLKTKVPNGAATPFTGN